MALSPVTRHLLSDQVFDQLFDELLDGELRVGDAVPSERRLSEVLGVSRPAIREALQRLSATSLLDTRHGRATTVRDVRRFAGLDLLPRLLVRKGELDLRVVRSVVEARLAIGPAVAALAAARADGVAARRLDASVDDLAAATDTPGRQRAVLAFWDDVVDTADSIVFRLMFNSLRIAYEPAIDVVAPVLEAEVSDVDAHRRLAAAISAGDADRASKEAHRLLLPASEAVAEVLDALEPSERSDTQRGSVLP